MQDLTKLKVPELKERLKQLNKPRTGKKADLLARLQAAIQAGAITAAPAPPQPSSLASSASVTASTSVNQPLPRTNSREHTQTTPKPIEQPSKAPSKSPDVAAPPPPAKKARLQDLPVKSKAPTIASTPTQPRPSNSTSKKHVLKPSPSTSAQASAFTSLGQAILNPIAPPTPKPKNNPQLTTTKRTPFKPPLLASSSRSLLSSHSPAPRPPPIPPFNPPRSLFLTPPHPTPTEALAHLTSSWPYQLYSSLSPSSSSSTAAVDPSSLLSPSLYSTPSPLHTHAHQFHLSHRFLTSRLYLLLSHSSLADLISSGARAILSLPSVQGCEPIVEGIWCVKLSDGTSVHVLEATGEVLGSIEGEGEVQLGQPNLSEEERARGRKLREDWAGYIGERKVGGGGRLYSLVGGGDGDEFVGGLSERVRREAAEKEEVAVLAVKYLLAQSTPNTISGPPTSLTTEAHLLSSLPAPRLSFSSPKPTFYLPPTHSLLSLHLSSTLHPSLFLAQTASAGGLICLKETGQCVGSEEEGVGEIWRGLLGCDERGGKVA